MITHSTKKNNTRLLYLAKFTIKKIYEIISSAFSVKYQDESRTSIFEFI